jgi:hypothetical protein
MMLRQKLFRYGAAAGLCFVGATNVMMMKTMCEGKQTNGSDCKKPVCADTSDMLRQAMQQSAGDTPRTGPFVLCPPDRATLGKHSWTLIHSMSLHFPDAPSTTYLPTYLQLFKYFIFI